MVEHQLRGHSLVELTSINKALLGRQPKLLNHFSHQFVYFKFARFNFACFNFDVFVFQCSEVLRCGKGEIAWKALCRPWGGVELNAGSFLHLEIFVKILVDGLGNVVTLKKNLSGASRRWVQRRDIE